MRSPIATLWQTQSDPQTNTQRLMVDAEEVRQLAKAYGAPIHRKYNVQASGTVLKHRWRKEPDRRAEVVFAIQGPCEQIWLHTKCQYENPIFRLPSGGIELHESVMDAMLREVEEETSLSVDVEHFTGLLEYAFHHQGSVAHFASYLFLLRSQDGHEPCPDGEEVAEFQSVLPSQLPYIANNLRNMLGERRCWGHWRALSHDVLYEALRRR